MDLGPLLVNVDAMTHQMRVEGMVTPGIEACLAGRADWCLQCNAVRYRHVMQWTLDGIYGCWVCLGRGVGTPALPTRREIAEADEEGARDMLAAWGL